jgi:hypothetical protein
MKPDIMEPPENPALSMTDVLGLVSELRETALEFQDNIEIFFSARMDWQKIKGRFASYEERFRSLEARLSELIPDPSWNVETELSAMMTELRSISEAFGEMREEFLRALQESPDRVM